MDETPGEIYQADTLPSSTKNTLAKILAALDREGVPDDFLTPADRAQTPPQQRPPL